MIYTHNLDPIAINLGAIKIHWYGIMYLLSFLAVVLILRLRISRTSWSFLRLFDIVLWCFLFGIIGARLGYMILYQLPSFLSNPLTLIYIWKGGMSFHGGLLGAIAGMAFFAFKEKMHLFEFADFVSPSIPIALAFGRLGNFINGELWGRATNGSWGVVFLSAQDTLPRHPSQLYEMFFEGILLFIILWIYSKKPRPRMSVSALFLLLYGIARFCIEFFRQPDKHLGYILFDFLTMGQILTLPMIVLGAYLLYLSYKKDRVLAIQ